jgi:elongation factor P
MFDTTDFRKGLKIEIDGEPFIIVEAVHVKPGKGVAFVKTRYKSLVSGNVLEKNFRSGDKVDKPDLEERRMTFLYRDASTNDWVFMDVNNYEQVFLHEEQVPGREFLKENTEVQIVFHNHKPISMDLPTFVELLVVETDPGVRGDTAQGGTKPAKLETGATILVPLYLNEGETVRVDTRTGEYVERVAR